MTNPDEFTQVGYIAVNPKGEWKVDYVSYKLGDPTLQTAIGTKLGPLVAGLEKYKDKYTEVDDAKDQKSQD